MQHIWSDEGKLARWLEVELAVLEGWNEIGAVLADVPARTPRAGDSCSHPSASPRSRSATTTTSRRPLDAVAEELGTTGAASIRG